MQRLLDPINTVEHNLRLRARTGGSGSWTQLFAERWVRGRCSLCLSAKVRSVAALSSMRFTPVGAGARRSESRQVEKEP